MSPATRSQTNLPNLLVQPERRRLMCSHPLGISIATLLPYPDDRRICPHSVSLRSRRRRRRIICGPVAVTLTFRSPRSVAGREPGCGDAPVLAFTRHLLAELINILSFPPIVVSEKFDLCALPLQSLFSI